jgi:hypothetical protein
MTPLKQDNYILIRVGLQSFHRQTCRNARIFTVTRAIDHGKQRSIMDGFYKMPIPRCILIRSRHGGNAIFQ